MHKPSKSSTQKFTFAPQYAWLKMQGGGALAAALFAKCTLGNCMYVHPKSMWLQHYVHMKFYGCAAKYTWFPHVLNNQQDFSLDEKSSYHISQRVILCTKPGVLVFFALSRQKKEVFKLQTAVVSYKPLPETTVLRSWLWHHKPLMHIYIYNKGGSSIMKQLDTSGWCTVFVFIRGTNCTDNNQILQTLFLSCLWLQVQRLCVPLHSCPARQISCKCNGLI